MKLWTLFTITMAGLIATGCSTQTASSVSEATPASETLTSETPAEAAAVPSEIDTDAGSTVEEAADEIESAPLNETATASSEDEAAPAESRDGDELDQLIAGDEPSEDEPEPTVAEMTQDQFNAKMADAARSGDFQGAADLIKERLVAFPDDVGLKVNQLAVAIRLDTEAGEGDKTAASARFLETAKLARDLEQHRDQLPPQLGQVFAAAQMNEARALAHGGNVQEAADAVIAIARSGFVNDFGWVERDPYFEKVRGEEAFQGAIDGIWATLAKEEIAEFESFDFDFELPNLDKETVSLASLKGKLVIVDIWGTWCPPCRQEIPHFVKLQSAYPEDLAIIGINYEDGGPDEIIETIRGFAEENSMNYTCVIGDDATRAQIPQFEGFPTTLFLDRTGKVRLKVVGYHPYEKLESYVKTLLDEAAEG